MRDLLELEQESAPGEGEEDNSSADGVWFEAGQAGREYRVRKSELNRDSKGDAGRSIDRRALSSALHFHYNSHGRAVRKRSKKGRKKEVTEGIKQKLQSELDELESELRVHLPREIKRAKEFGDLRENAEYHAALARQQFVQARIRDLRQRLSEVSSIDLSRVPHDRVAYGSTVVLFDTDTEEEITYRLVTAEESDPDAGLISTTSPVGRSLMGHEEGDEVKVVTPSGARRFEIRSLTTLHDQPEG